MSEKRRLDYVIRVVIPGAIPTYNIRQIEPRGAIYVHDSDLMLRQELNVYGKWNGTFEEFSG